VPGGIERFRIIAITENIECVAGSTIRKKW
jgi:hypothetical protein